MTHRCSRKTRKKAKKSKRVSIAEPESTPATPTEEKTVTLEDPPVPIDQTPEHARNAAVNSEVDVQPSAPVEKSSEVVQETSLEEPFPLTSTATQDEQQGPTEEPSASSKKDKKKGKKAKRVSIAEPESARVTPVEEKTEVEIQPVSEPEVQVDEPTSTTLSAPVLAQEPAPEILPVGEPVVRDVQVDESTSTQMPVEEVVTVPTEDDNAASSSSTSLSTSATHTPAALLATR